MSIPSQRGEPAYYPPAARPLPPSVATTVVITLLFGIFGIIPAASNASKATQLGYPSGKYWGAFFLILAGWFVLVARLFSAGA